MTARPADLVERLPLLASDWRYCSLARAHPAGGAGIDRLPFCLRALLDNLLWHAVHGNTGMADAQAVLRWPEHRRSDAEIRFRPLRVMMDDTAGLPLIGDLAAMRDAAAEQGADPRAIDPVLPIDFVVDHSIIADHAGAPDAAARNAALEIERNRERFEFLRWGAQAFGTLRVHPPGSGICHQIHLEHLASVVAVHDHGGAPWLRADGMVGIDSHTPMVNALGVVGFGVPGLDGLAAALGEPVSLRLPEVLGIRLVGQLRPGVLATDLALTLVAQLREHGVVGRFVEYFGPGLDALTCPDRATVSNMTPECGATMSWFPVDAQTLRYLRATGRSRDHIERVAAYARAQQLWRDGPGSAAAYTDVLTVDLAAVAPSMSGPRFPHARVAPAGVPDAFRRAVGRTIRTADATRPSDGHVAIAAITSCTNTSNPTAMIAAGLVARNAVARGMRVPGHVKTSFSPGSRVVPDYLAAAGLLAPLEALGFHVTGFGCMTCVGFSGPLADPAREAAERGVALAAVLSGNRNYDGRVHAQVHSAFLASPPLVVAYALAGSVLVDPTADVLGTDAGGAPVRLADLWPEEAELQALADAVADPQRYRARYADPGAGSAAWHDLAAPAGHRYAWDPQSTVIRAPRIEDAQCPAALTGARVLAVFGDLVTTEHVSPMGPIPPGSAAARHLESRGVPVARLGTYAARRLDHEVMMRGTFAFPGLANALVPGHPGGLTRDAERGEVVPIYEAAVRYRASGTPLVVVAGRDYGTGSSRDWSAKGPRMLGVRAILAVSFERIHRANLVAAGVLPLALPPGITPAMLALTGAQTLDVEGLGDLREPRARVRCVVRRPGEETSSFEATALLDTEREVAVWRAGGTIRSLLRGLLDRAR